MAKYCYHCMRQMKNDAASFCPYCGKKNDVETPNHHIKPGTILYDKFLIGMAIGEGGFGITYIGRDLNLDIKVAIKEYYPSGYVNRNNSDSNDVTAATSKTKKDFFDSGRKKFLQEARILAKFCGEPGIVDVRDFFEANNTVYIAMEYLDGKDLKQYLKEVGKLSPAQTLQLMQPVMQTLTKVHANGVIHRDISPDNLRLTKNGIKLMDFGAARDISYQSHSVILKVGYAPEEQYRSRGEQGPWTDVYALCATMYKCITGITPDESIERTVSDELKTPSSLGIEIDPVFENALMKGLSVFQKDRYQSVDELMQGFSGQEQQPDSDAKTFIPQAGADADDSKTVFSADEDVATAYVAGADDSKTAVSEEEAATAFVQNTDSDTVYSSSKRRTHTVGTDSDSSNSSVATNQQSSVVSDRRIITESQSSDQTNTAETNSPIFSPKKVKAVEVIKEKAIAMKNLFVSLMKIKKYRIATIASISTIALIVIISVVVNVISNDNNDRRDISTDHIITASDKSKDTSEAPIINDSTDTYISFSGQVVSVYDVRNTAAMKMLQSLYFTDCKFEDGAFAYLAEMSGPIQYLYLENCTGIDDYSSLSSLSTLQTLQIKGCQLTNNQISKIDFSKLRSLYGVYLSKNPNLSDISSLSNVGMSLTHLDVSETMVKDFTALNDNSKLYEIKANGNGLNNSDIETIPTAELNYLYLSKNSISDISTIGRFKGLYELDLSENQISDISPISSFAKLYSLNINDNKVISLSALVSCGKLQSVYARGNQLTNLDGLQSAIKLTEINVAKNAITDITGLTNCTVLERVNLASNKITDISVLAKSADKLEILYFNNNKVKDISALKGTVKLKYLNFDSNKVVSLEALSKSGSIKTLSAQHNSIKSLKGIKTSSKLEYVYLSHNKIKAVPSAVYNCANLYLLDLSSNLIEDASWIGKSKSNYNLLALYNNPVTSLSGMENGNGRNLIISYNEEFNPEDFKDKFDYYYFIDCPLDKQIRFKNAIEGEYGFSVNYVTVEDADNTVKESRKYAF